MIFVCGLAPLENKDAMELIALPLLAVTFILYRLPSFANSLDLDPNCLTLLTVPERIC